MPEPKGNEFIPIPDKEGEVADWTASGPEHKEAITLPRDPQEFSRLCRELLNTDYSDPFGLHDDQLRELAVKLGLDPLALYNRRGGKGPGHWSLIVSRVGQNLTLYDPLSGLKNIPWGQFFKEARDDRRPPILVIYLVEESLMKNFRQDPSWLEGPTFYLPTESLRRLGATQRNSTQCGDMCLYAAAVARGKIKL